MPVFSIITNGKSGVNTIYTSNASAEDGESVISPKIKKDTNKADSFEFMILPNHSFYDEFEKKKTYVYVKRDNKYIFRGRVSEIKTDIFRQRTVTCEGDLAYLADTVQFPNKETTTQKNTSSTKKHKRNTLYYVSGHETGHETGSTSKDTVKMTPKAYFRNVIAVHNGQVNSTGDNERTFTVGSITVSDTNNSENFERTSHQDTSSVISSDLLSIYGGILRTRFENNTTYIDWLDEYNGTTSQEIRFGVNLIDLDQEPPSDDAWSVLLPIGDENTTIASANNGNKFLIDQEALDKYGYIVHYHKFNNVKNSDELMGRAQTYLNTHAKVFPDNIVVKAIDLQLIGESDDPIELGDKVKVVSTPHGLNTTMACIKMELDIQNPENNSYTIGTIMPPDKEKKKESLSEKHNSSRRSSSRGIGNNRNDIEGLMGDMDAASNNINVNAENIAVNALNIAVNAENIAIVAKNIAIAAEQIDVQAQNITVALGNEADDLYGKIEASAEGIKSTFRDNTTGLSSYFEQKAGEITAAISSADNSISGKVTLTENNLTTEFNKKLYGDDGNGGIVADYNHKIVTSAEGTKDYMSEVLYGDDPDNPSPTSYYWRVRSDTAESTITTFHSELYGGLGFDPTNPKAGTYFDAVYTQTSERNRTFFKKELYGLAGSADNPEAGTVLYAVYDQAADGWKYELWGNGTKDNPASGSILYGTQQELGARVKQGDIEAGFTITTGGIKLFGKEVSLGKYATVESISGTNGMFTRLVSGTDTATHLKATTLSVDNLQVYRSAGSASEYKKYYVSMVKRNDTTYYTTDYVLSTNSSGILDLSHSHSCTTNSDGTIKLGGAVAAGSGGSFKIADTKAYKDGVSAATNAVTVDSVGLNTKDYTTSGIGTAQTDKTPIWFSSPKTFYARIRAEASNAKHREASITIDATKAYDAGVSSVTVSEVKRNPSSPDDSYNSSTHETTIHIRADASNGDKKSANFTVSGTSAYNAGVSSVDVTNIVRNPSSYDDTYLGGTNHSTRIHLRASASNGHTKDANFEVSGSNAYSDGHTDGYNSVSVAWIGRNATYSDTYDSSTHNTTIHIQATASNGAERNENITAYGSNAYNSGYNDGNSAGYNSGYTNGRNSVNMNDVTVTHVTVNAATGNATVSISLPNAAGTKKCTDVEIKNLT